MSAWQGRGNGSNGHGRGSQTSNPGRRDPMGHGNNNQPREQFPALGNLGPALPQGKSKLKIIMIIRIMYKHIE